MTLIAVSDVTMRRVFYALWSSQSADILNMELKAIEVVS
jgi:hypothetical protein